MLSKFCKNKYFWLIAAITLIGGGLRLLLGYLMGTFWFDEYFGVYFAQYPFREMLGYIIQDTNLPLYNILLWGWLRLVGQGELAVRLLSIIIGTINIPFFYLLGKRLFSKPTGILASFFYAILLFMVYYTTEARVYAIMIFLSLASTWFFWNLLEKRKTFFNWLGYFLSSILLLYGHLLGAMLILAQALFIIFEYHKRKKTPSGWLAGYFLLAVLYLPYLVFYFLDKKDIALDGWQFNISNLVYFFGGLFRNLFAFYNFLFRIEVLFSLIPLLILGSFVYVKKTRDIGVFELKFKFSNPVIYCLLVIACHFLAVWLFGWLIPRYVIIAYVFILLLLAEGINNWWANKGLKKILIGFLIILFIIPYAEILEKRDVWHEVNDCLLKITRADSKIIAHSFANVLLLKKYYTGNLPVAGFYPLNDNLSFNERMVKNNWRRIVTNDNVGELSEFIEGFNSIYLLEASSISKDVNLVYWLLNHDWRLLPQESCIVENVKINHFVRENL